MQTPAASADLIHFEYPLNERVRIYLRIEYLLKQVDALISRNTPLDQHFALTTIFEIIEVGSRNDLRSEVLKDMERQRQHLLGLRDNPDINPLALDQILIDYDEAYKKLSAHSTRMGQSLLAIDALTSIRNRIHIPGGTCEFDLPAYHAWLHTQAEKRQADLLGWVAQLDDYSHAIRLLLHMLRERMSSGQFQAKNAQFQQILASERAYQLARVSIASALGYYPVMSGTKLMLSIRFNKFDLAIETNQDEIHFTLGLSA